MLRIQINNKKKRQIQASHTVFDGKIHHVSQSLVKVCTVQLYINLSLYVCDLMFVSNQSTIAGEICFTVEDLLIPLKVLLHH